MKGEARPAVTRRVCLYGSSVMLGSLAATLRHYSQLEIATIVPPISGPAQLEALSPDVVLFDLESPHRADLLLLLEHCPRSLLVGVSPDTNLVRMWTGLELEELSTKDLMDVIEEQLERVNVSGARDHAPSAGPQRG